MKKVYKFGRLIYTVTWLKGEAEVHKTSNGGSTPSVAAEIFQLFFWVEGLSVQVALSFFLFHFFNGIAKHGAGHF